ncbi:hypothetical protein G9A89_022626 [Geosiphon pyriformis]|nr:hypothetical protein G9A89_022626 [Geosiphon pyriformis]
MAGERSGTGIVWEFGRQQNQSLFTKMSLAKVESVLLQHIRNIFLDDVNNSTLLHSHLNNETEVHASDALALDPSENDLELSSFPDIQPEELLLSETDDATVQSTTMHTVDYANGRPPYHNSAHDEYLEEHAFDHVTRDETASYKIMSLLDSSEGTQS